MSVRVWCTNCDCEMDESGVAFDCPEDGAFFTCPICKFRIVVFSKDKKPESIINKKTQT